MLAPASFPRRCGALLLWLLAAPAAAAQLGEIRIGGVDEALRDNVRLSLSIAQEARDRPLSEARLEYLLKRLPIEARAALEPFGIYDAEVESEVTRRGETVDVTVRIDAGDPVRVRRQQIVISGAAGDDPVIGKLRGEFEPALGAVFRHAVYEDSKRAIQRGLLARGYFDAELNRARVEVTRAEHAADILLDWDSGPRAHFGELRISGSQVDEALLRNRARENVVAGAPFDQADLLRMHARLAELDYFSVIDVQPLPGEASGEPPLVPIELSLQPARRSIYRAGVSYGTDSGLGLRFGFDRRWLNRRGHKWTSEAILGQRRSMLAAQYRIPAFERLPGWWAIGVLGEQKQSTSVDSDVVGLLVSRSTEWRGDKWMAEWHVDRERYVDREVDERRYSTLVYPALHYERKRLDEPLYPRSGYSIAAHLRAGSTAIGSDVDFVQAWGELRTVFGLGDRQRLLLVGQLGRTFGDRLEALPPSLRFYTGGDRSVRGYGYQELGPRNTRGDVIGGRNLAVASIEFERMFNERWGGAVFVDAGNAFSGTDFDPAVGVGVGLRWRSPIGPVRVDVAHGLDSPDRMIRLHLTAGPQL